MRIKSNLYLTKNIGSYFYWILAKSTKRNVGVWATKFFLIKQIILLDFILFCWDFDYLDLAESTKCLVDSTDQLAQCKYFQWSRDIVEKGCNKYDVLYK